jgi:hypothetical protein
MNIQDIDNLQIGDLILIRCNESYFNLTYASAENNKEKIHIKDELGLIVDIKYKQNKENKKLYECFVYSCKREKAIQLRRDMLKLPRVFLFSKE